MGFQLTEPTLAYLAIRVNHLEKMADFYEKEVGLYLISLENNLAYFSSEKEQKYFFIIEGTPKGLKEVKEKRLARFSIQVKNQEILLALKERLIKRNIPLEKSLQLNHQMAFTMIDPEGNRVTFFATKKEEPFAFQLKKIHLNWQKEAGEKEFLENALGLKPAFSESYFQLADHQWLGFQHKETTFLGGERILGIDFVGVCLKDAAEIKMLSEHLEKENLPFYKDKNLSLLTVFDNQKIEWWFFHEES